MALSWKSSLLLAGSISAATVVLIVTVVRLGSENGFLSKNTKVEESGRRAWTSSSSRNSGRERPQVSRKERPPANKSSGSLQIGSDEFEASLEEGFQAFERNGDISTLVRFAKDPALRPYLQTLGAKVAELSNGDSLEKELSLKLEIFRSVEPMLRSRINSSILTAAGARLDLPNDIGWVQQLPLDSRNAVLTGLVENGIRNAVMGLDNIGEPDVSPDVVTFVINEGLKRDSKRVGELVSQMTNPEMRSKASVSIAKWLRSLGDNATAEEWESAAGKPRK